MQGQIQQFVGAKSALPLTVIMPGRYQPRTYFDPKEMDELASSIKAQGVIQAITVRPFDADDESGGIGKVGEYEIIAGERRWRASQMAGLSEIPVLVREVSIEVAAMMAATENIQRSNMSPTEEAKAAAKMLPWMQNDRDEVARHLGLDRQTLDSRLALLNCSDNVQKALNERKIKLGHAELLAAVTKEMQDKVLTRMLAADAKMPTVDELKAQLEQISCLLTAAIFDKGDCAGCQHNSGNQGALFAEAISEGKCTNRDCYNGKTEAVLEARVAELTGDYPTVKIVRNGDNFTVVKLAVDGPTGVGTEQASACKGCANFGAVVSAVPDKLGRVSKDICFDPACNQKKVAARIKAEKGPQDDKGAAGKKGSGSAGKNGKANGPKKKAKSTKVEASRPVKDYRLKIWRKAFQEEAAKETRRSHVLLLALAVSGLAREINGTKMSTALQKLTSCGSASFTSSPDTAAVVIAQADDAKLARLVELLAAAACDDLPEGQLVKLLTWMDVDLANHWVLNKDLLSILTKSEIEAIAIELGIKDAIGDTFSKVMSGKKDEVIKAVLEVPNFDYKGKVPAVMQFEGE